MTCPDYIREALAQFANCFDTGRNIAVPTQCLYPSNGAVTVFLSGGPQGCVISDEGQSIFEIGRHGLEVRNPDSFLRQFCTPRGLSHERGKIFTPPIPAEGVASAISLVATTSCMAAHWGVHNLRTRLRRDLRKELRDVLGLRFAEDRIKEDYRLSGFSGRQYRFEFVVEVGEEKRLVVDGVSPEPTTINTRAIAHLDLARAQDPKFVQRIVYDDAEAWAASDINVLRMAAELVPMARFGNVLDALGWRYVHGQG